MKRVFLDDARPSDVSHAVRDVLERRGALVSEHVSSRVRFHGLSGKHTWSRAGYVGIYQALGEKEVEVRLVLRARWTWRILLAVAAVNVLLAILVAVTDPPPNTWIFVGFTCGFTLLVAGLVHLTTLRPTVEEERLLMEDFEAELRRGIPGVHMEDEEERALREAELELEGEVTAKRVELARKAEPPAPKAPKAKKGLGLGLLPRRTAPAPTAGAAPEAPAEESVEEKRARLLARKAELEARKRGDQGP